MKRSKAPRIIAGILFILYGLAMLLVFFAGDVRVVRRAIRLPYFIYRILTYIGTRSGDIYSYAANTGGIIAGALMLAALILIAVGLFCDKRAVTAVGAGFGLLLQLLMSVGFLYALDRTSATGSRLPIIEVMRMTRFVYSNRFMLPINLLMILAFAALLVASLSRRTARIFGWIGGAAALVRIVPMGFLYVFLYLRGLRFIVSPLGVILSLMLSAAIVLAGYGLFRRRESRPAAAPAAQPRPIPNAPQYAPAGMNAPTQGMPQYAPAQNAYYPPQPQAARPAPERSVRGTPYPPGYAPAPVQTQAPAPAQTQAPAAAEEAATAALNAVEEPAPVPAAAEKPAAAPQLDPVETLRRFKGLLDDGIITPEEYEAKKKQLLDM